MYAQAENIENFTGTLIRRQYKPGQKYIQLVFETAEGLRLSLSRNLSMVRSLTIGQTYRVKGPKISVGDKIYIHEPTAVLLPQTAKAEAKPAPSRILSRRIIVRKVLKFLLVFIGCVLVAGGSAGASYMISKRDAPVSHVSRSETVTTQRADPPNPTLNTGTNAPSADSTQPADSSTSDAAASSASQPTTTTTHASASTSPAPATQTPANQPAPPSDTTAGAQGSQTPPPDPSSSGTPTNPGTTSPNPPTN